MDNARETIRQIADHLPNEAGWDNIWSRLVTASEASAKHRPQDTRSLLESSLDELPETAEWDQAWDAVINGYQRSDKREDFTKNPAQQNVEISKGAVMQVAESPLDTSSAPPIRPEDLSAKGWKRKLAAFAWLAVGIGILIFFDTQIERVTTGMKHVVQLITPLWLYIAFLLHRSGRYFTQRYKDLISSDTRPPVLYLRTFKSDERAAEPEGPTLTEEEQWTRILKSIGPVIALDDPRGEAHFPGATRISASDSSWQDYIEAQMKQARLIVIRLADTPAVFWEFQQARELLEARQLLLMVPAVSPEEYGRCRDFAQRILDTSLPDIDFEIPLWQRIIKLFTRSRNFQYYFSFLGCIYFDKDWQGHYQQATLNWRAFLHSPINQYGKASMTYCLKPVFNQLDIPWPEPKLNLVTTALFFTFVGGALWGFVSTLMH